MPDPLLPSTGGAEERENSVMTAFRVTGNRPLRQKASQEVILLFGLLLS